MGEAADAASGGAAHHDITLEGIAGSPGYAVGRAMVLDRRGGSVRRHVASHQVEDELERFDRAVAAAAARLKAAAERTRGSRAESSILEAYVLMVEDETLRDEVERHVRIGNVMAYFGGEL